MDLPFYWVDAFTERTFGGNPAGVVALDSWPEDSLLQRIANENGLPATGFFIRTGPASADLRWFTTSMELELCGHASLATAHVLFNELGQKETPFVFKGKAGPLSVVRKGPLLELDFPSRPAAVADATEELIAGMGLAPSQVLRIDGSWLCIYESPDQVAALAPDAGALAKITPGRFIATAPGRDCDYVCRFFAPAVGIYEDAVTGSAQCTLVPYWAQRLGKSQFHSRQISKRGGELWCALEGDRVRIAGRCSLYLQGRITL
jgi:PhzF family phenazine biosynthesis protein